MSSPLKRARARSRPFRQFRRARGGGNTPFHVERASPTPDPGPESEFVYWHPERMGVELAPPAVLAQLHAIHPTLSACRPPAKAPVPRPRWLVWARDPKATNSFCPGWYLVFVWEVTKTKAFLPLEPFSHLEECIYAVMATKIGGVGAYFKKMQAERQAAKAGLEATYQDTRQAKQREFLASHRISTAGRGNRFALHHDGTIAPSRSELNWLRKTAESRMPSEVRQRLQAERDQLRQVGFIPGV